MNLPDAVLNPPRSHLPVLTAALLKKQCEDFDVEELPAYLPDGAGEHLYLWIEKRDLPAGELLSRISRAFGISSRDVGVAGQKDRRAVTRQFVSVPRSCESKLNQLDHDCIQILSVSAHGNKLRTGHLNGNRFRIVLRPVDESPFADGDAENVRQRLADLEATGFPNAFGPQRFGHGGNTAVDGIRFLKSEITAKHWSFQQRRFMTKMVASAAQAAVFNLAMANRVTQKSFTTPTAGDVVCRRGGMRPFQFDDRGDIAAEELIPMGPMPGPKMMAAKAPVVEDEVAAMRILGLTEQDFDRHKKLTSGTRRKYVEFPSNTSATLTDDGGVQVQFELPSGAFATTLLSEVVGELR